MLFRSFSDRRQAARGVRTSDIAKRLIDYGFHPYTISAPESVSKEEMDSFIDALRSIAQEVEENPGFVLKAPYTTRVTRLDEAGAARKPVLRWKPSH